MVTAMVVALSPNFILRKKVKFKKELPVQHKAPIAIGIPVKPIKLVKTMELNGVIPTSGIMPPKIAPMTSGLVTAAVVIALPMTCKIIMTTGEIKPAMALTNIGPTKTTTIKSRPPVTFFSIHLIKKLTKYAAMKAGKSLTFNKETPSKTLKQSKISSGKNW
jgi:hypothetical protein